MNNLITIVATFGNKRGHEVKLYSDRGDKYYLFGQFELYLMLIQCVFIGILVALAYVLIRLGGGI